MAVKALIPALSSDRKPTDLEALIRVEKEIDQRVKAFGQASVEFAPVVQVLTIINDSEAWRWHVDEETSEPLHKSFRAYVESFGWSQSVPRLYQLMKEFRQAQIDYADENPDAPRIDGINYDYEARTRSTGTSLVRFADTQSRALGRFVDNFETAAHNIFESDPGRPDAILMAAEVKRALTPVRDALAAINAQVAEAKEAAKAEKKALRDKEREQKAYAKAAAKAAAEAEGEVDPDESDDSLAD